MILRRRLRRMPPALLGMGVKRTLIQSLTALGLTTGLQLALDAGDANSYTSGQSWLDTNGNNCDFFLGADGSATASDPTFTGTPGGLSSEEYWAFDGGDYFTRAAANDAWINNLHKGSAAFTLAGYIWPGSLAVLATLFGTNGQNTANIGVDLLIAATTGNIGARCRAAGVLALNQNGSAIPVSAWSFFAWSQNEAGGAGASFLQVNSTVTTFNGVYTTPSASDATYTAQIGAAGNAVNPLRSGSRLPLFMAWEGAALTQAQLLAVFNATRGRFGI